MDSKSQQGALIRMTPQDTLGQKTSQDVILASSYGAGRIVNELFESAGEKLGKKLDTFAMKTGWGPTDATKQIRKMLGEGDARKQSLNSLYAAFGEEAHGHCCDFSDLQKACRNLMKYTLPKESCGTQVAAFKGIIELTTRYPHLRRIILRSNDLETPDKKSAALKRWRRPGNVDDREWTFFSELAATCISDGDMTKTVETTPPSEAGLITSKDGGLVEYLVRKINCCAHYEISCAVGVRYLGGVLESPSFWQEIDLETHQSTTQRLFNMATRLSKDSGIEHEVPKDPNAEQFSDVEGVDMLISVIMIGVKEWLGPRSSKYLEEQYWSTDFMELFQLLIMNKTRILLPNSRDRAVREFECLIEYKEEQISHSADISKAGEIRMPGGIDTNTDTEGSTSIPSIPEPSESFTMIHDAYKAPIPATNDMVVVVMGPTGSGKSTFIEYATAQGRSGSGRNSGTHTQDICLVKSRQSIHGRRIVFVDTPGFDDTYKSDIEILSLTPKWLVQAYGANVKIDGILYFHRISDNRMFGSPLNNLELFASICGKKAMKNVTLVTTMWGHVPEETGARREEELKHFFWNEMIDNGNGIRRFKDSTDCALDIVKLCLGEDKPLLLTHQVVERHKALKKTEAGITLNNQLQKLLKDQKDAEKRFKELAPRPGNEQAKAELKKRVRELKQKVDKTSEQLNKLGSSWPFGRRKDAEDIIMIVQYE